MEREIDLTSLGRNKDKVRRNFTKWIKTYWNVAYNFRDNTLRFTNIIFILISLY